MFIWRVLFFPVDLLVRVVSREDAVVGCSRRKLLLGYRRGRAAGNSLLLVSVFYCICALMLSLSVCDALILIVFLVFGFREAPSWSVCFLVMLVTFIVSVFLY